jgi:hypothetical protein
MTSRGILGWGAYLPARRLDRSAIASVAGGSGGTGTRAVAGYDEDATTMGVAAARLALRPASTKTRSASAPRPSSTAAAPTSTRPPCSDVPDQDPGLIP